MQRRLLERLARPTTFVVGKGGVGKTTTAAGLAVALAEAGTATHLLSTDPAHSLGDFFEQELGAAPERARRAPGVTLEEVDGVAVARARLDALHPALLDLIGRGTYLDTDDAGLLLGAAVPGLDEIGAALRIAELARDGRRLVVDTAPTGHTLRLLELEDTVASWIDVFRAMAEKADAVASALVRRSVRLDAENALDRLAGDMAAFTAAVRAADFVVVTTAGGVVEAETRRLTRALADRGLEVAATVSTDRPSEPPARAPAGRGGSRALDLVDRELMLFAGKGGVGKSTCAAACAVVLAERGPVSLIGVDPAGSLADVVSGTVAGLSVEEVDAAAELERFRARYHEEVEAVFEAVGLDGAAHLDRQVIASLWGLAPPGIDELVAMARLADDVEPGTRLVLDTAPTGHFLRLLAMPELGLDWIHRIMRILLKYRAVAGLDAPGESLLRLAKQLRALQERLADPSRTAITVVTIDAPLIRAETERLLHHLDTAGLPTAALLVNRSAATPARVDGPVPVIRAPVVEEPVGPDGLRAFAGAWEVAG